MSKGLSLNIGINELKTSFYSTSGKLRCSENDARAMAALSVMEGYETPMLLVNEQATKGNFLKYLGNSIKSLDTGDTFLLSFSGHGGQIDDDNGDEKDGKDETWCLYDEHIVDDDIGDMWKAFKPGVRIIVVSSSCHSRTAIKVWDKNCFSGNSPGEEEGCEKEIIINEKTILSSHILDPEIKADILHLSACADNQEARAGYHFSKFTDLLLKNWDYGRFKGDYESLVAKIRMESGYKQRPGIRTLGVNRSFLQNQIPFKLY